MKRGLKAQPLRCAAVAAVLLLLFAGCGSDKGAPLENMPTAGTDITREPSSRTVATATTPVPVAPPAPLGVAAGTAGLPAVLGAFNADLEFSELSTLADDRFEGRRTGSAGARAAAAYISGKYAALGLSPWQAIGLGSFNQPFSARGLSSDNVIGIIPGAEPGAGYIVLGAHYDHLGMDPAGQVFNGADDNAAGVAALLETARIFQQLDLKPRKTVVFASFSGEEEGELGAAALGQAITDAGLAAQVEMINIDGIGATGGGYFGVWDEGTPEAAPLVAALHEAGRYLGVTVQEDGTDIGSDAQAFDWQFGIPAVTVDWTWGQDPSQYHPYYHTVDDDPQWIDRTVLATASKVAIAGLWLRAS
jgi:hypothetical protein